MTLKVHTNGELTVTLPSGEVRYPRTAGNQMILCARMNEWDGFLAMWRKKTDATVWPEITQQIEPLAPAKRWKLKESFARLATTEEDPSLSTPSLVKEIPLL